MKMSKESPSESYASNTILTLTLNHETSSINIPEYNPAFPVPVPSRNRSTAMPQIITTTKILRRFCGFILAFSGFLFYCLRVIGLFAWLGINYYRDFDFDWVVGGLEGVAGGLGIVLFFRVMKYPHLTLESHNFKNVFWFFLIPLVSFIKIFLASFSSICMFLPCFEIIFYSGYVYGLSLNGRSSSLWAGFKPYKYEMVPLILPVQPSSRAFPQYTVPFPRK